MRPRDEDSEKITVEPAEVKGQATENPADEAKILGDQDETMDVLEAEAGETEDRPGDLYAGDAEDFVQGQLDVKQQMDRRMREAEKTLGRKDFKPDHLKDK